MATTIVSIDLDPPSCYRTIHGLAPASAEVEAREGELLALAVARFLALFADIDIHATFFVIGRSLQPQADPGGHLAKALRDALAAGHELANHSFAHAYDLAVQSPSAQARDLQRCDAALRQLGALPQGFRAPGYIHSPALLREAAALGYTYDSSSLPSPSYFLAKHAKMAWMRVFGRRSGASWGGIRSFVGDDRPHRLEGVGLWEVPISVTPTAKIPAIGTFLLAGPQATRKALWRHLATAEYAHLEFHALDLLAVGEPALSAELGQVDPSLKVPLDERLDRARALLRGREGGATIGSVFAQLR